jgi:hypothetical protein
MKPEVAPSRTWFLMVATLLACGCGPSAASERSGPEMRRSLPKEVDSLMPGDAILCHQESGEKPMAYSLWIFRGPGKDYLALSEELPGKERHNLPEGVLGRVFASKAPWVETGQATSGECRYTHWKRGEVEYQVREMITDRGWFASVEQIGP